MRTSKSSRKSLSKKTRFEVFKRDKFTCQYCGETAPSVVLQCDHIHPVAQGGTNEILNLVTSCVDCNSGKGARLLGDDAEISKQVAQLAELEERRQQLEMLMDWRDELKSQKEEAIDRIASVFSVGNYSCNENGLNTIKKWLRIFSAEEIISAADEAFEVYGEWDENDLTKISWEKAFSKVPGIIRVRRQEYERPYLRRLFYIQGIIRNRSRIRNLDCMGKLSHIAECGADLDEVERKACTMSVDDFCDHYDEWLNRIGRPF